MSIISAEDRHKQLEERALEEKELAMKTATHFKIEDEKEKKSLIEQLTVRERLLRRLRFRTTIVNFQDDLGPIDVEVRLLDQEEQRRIAFIQRCLREIADEQTTFAQKIIGIDKKFMNKKNRLSTRLTKKKISPEKFRTEIVKLNKDHGQTKIDLEEELSKMLENVSAQGVKYHHELAIICASICVDPTLDFDFWSRGSGFNIDVPAQLLAEASRLSASRGEGIRSFRAI